MRVANLLLSNGGHIHLSKYWAKNFLYRMGFVKQKANTTAKVTVSDLEACKSQFSYTLLKWKKFQ